MEKINRLNALTTMRTGVRPSTTPTNPHKQTNENGFVKYAEMLIQKIAELPGVFESETLIGERGTLAFFIEPSMIKNSYKAFLTHNEFVHIHSAPDFSLHIALPVEVIEKVIQNGWGEMHPLAKRGFIHGGIIMLYSPRDENEVDILFELIVLSWKNATTESVIV